MNSRVDEQLDAVIRRMLSMKPQERGAAKELAEALERESEREGSGRDEPLFEWETLKRTEWPQEELAAVEELGHRARRRDRDVVHIAAEADAARRVEVERQQATSLSQIAPHVQHGTSRGRTWRGLLWLTAVVMAGALMLWPRERGAGNFEEALAAAQSVPTGEKQDGGAIYVGDTALTSSYAAKEAPAGRGFTLEVPPKPVPGQIKPDAKGQCHKGQVALNGGCWFELKLSLDDCVGNGAVYYVFYKGTCYSPSLPSAREPTSAPTRTEGPEQ